MFRHGEISTEADRGPFLFTLAAFLGCTTAAVLLFTLASGQALAVFAGILLAIVGLAAAAVLLAIVTDRAYVENGTLYMRYLFRRAEIPLDQIGRVSLKDDVYSVFDRRGALRGTINAKLTGIDRLLVELDKNGVSFE